MNIEKQIAEDMRRTRRDVLLRRVMHALQQTIQLQGIAPDTPIEDVRAILTDESVRVIAPLLEAVDILECIIWASDGCMGHKHCAHSMEPWQRARALLQGKWEADTDPERRWPEPSSASGAPQP